MTAANDLLKRASSCYVRANMTREAAGCLERAGDVSGAARLLDQEGDPAAAARCLEAGGMLEAAAGRYLQAGDRDRAIDCFARGGNALEAGWLACADGSIGRARALFEDAQPEDATGRLRRSLGLARCLPAQAQRWLALEQVILDVERAIDGELTSPERRAVEQWAAEVTAAEGRFDLTGRVFAASCRADDWSAPARWRDWAQRVLGDTTGIPVDRSAAVAQEADR